MNATTLLLVLCWFRLRDLTDHADPGGGRGRLIADVLATVAFVIISEFL